MARSWKRRYDQGDPTLERLRGAIGHLPAVHEEETWGVLTLRVGRKLYGFYYGGLNGEPHALAFKAVPSEVDALRADQRFSVEPHYDSWLVLDLDRVEDWAEVRELLTDSFTQVAPADLATAVGGRPG